MSFESIAKKIAEFQQKHAKLILLFFMVSYLLLIPGILQLVNHVEPSLEKVLPQETLEIKTMNQMRSEFGADMIYIVLTTESPLDDVRNPKAIEYLSLLEDKLVTRDYILSAQSLNTIIINENDGVIPNTKQEVENILGASNQADLYVSDDYQTTLIKLQTDTGSSAKIVTEVLDSIDDDITSLEAYNPGFFIQVTGTPAIDKATFSVIISDFSIITIISMIFIMFIVLFVFKSLIRGMLPMVVVVNALLWTMGVAGYLQLTLTVVSMVAAAMLMGLGIDFGIHYVHSYFELRKNNSANKSQTETLSELLRAMVAASLTTIAGFLALLFGVLPAMKILGIILAMGIFFTLIGAVFLLPVVVYFYDNNLYSKNIKKNNGAN